MAGLSLLVTLTLDLLMIRVLKVDEGTLIGFFALDFYSIKWFNCQICLIRLLNCWMAFDLAGNSMTGPLLFCRSWLIGSYS